MKTLERRSFLALVSQAVTGTALLPLASALPVSAISFQNNHCWLDVAAPFLIQDDSFGMESEIVLTADNFIGSKGYADGLDSTEYEIYVYDSAGNVLGHEGVKRFSVPAMQATVIAVRDLVGPKTNFWGGVRIRLRPKTRTPSHASDLFSSAFIRWKTNDSFTNVHANPDPLEWQRADSFFYSMPFPPLRDFDCLYSLFNPYAERSSGMVTLFDPFGVKLKELPYDLKSHASLLVDLRNGEYATEVSSLFSPTQRLSNRNHRSSFGANGGTIAVTNNQGTVKNFGYLLIKQASAPRFSVEHPIHQPPFNPAPARMPFDTQGRFKAQNVLYTPLVFRSKKIGGVTLESRFHLSSGAPVEGALWMSPLITDGEGNVVWQAGAGEKFPSSISDKQQERGAIKLGGQQSCILDSSKLELAKGFSGGLSLAIAPLSNHTLMKVELRVAEWDAVAFTHFRPGLAAARAYQKPVHRAGLATDYVGSGARLQRNGNKITRDEVIGVMNIDDKSIPGNPTLEVFSAEGLLRRIELGNVPAFSCRHYLLSEILSGKIPATDLSLRLVDDRATLLMSIIHLDYERRDIAADHGSDRFSTFNEFTCSSKV
jgi:hypothetical protein